MRIVRLHSSQMLHVGFLGPNYLYLTLFIHAPLDQANPRRRFLMDEIVCSFLVTVNRILRLRLQIIDAIEGLYFID